MWKVIQLKGRREYMEDRYIVKDNFYKQYDLYCVFDGHGGYDVAEHCKLYYPDILLENLNNHKNIRDALYNSFIQLDESIPQEKGYMTGSTCLVILKGLEDVWVANCGDSRAILNTGKDCIQITEDHKPVNLERKRIEDDGGFVTKYMGDVWRVNGELALSRAIGDKRLRPHVIPNPEIFKVNVNTNNKFIISATDGLWDLYTNETVNRIVLKEYSKTNVADNLVILSAINNLLSVIYENVDDNTTILLIHLRR
jgi:serine/threonine protein phosphatase PrpC